MTDLHRLKLRIREAVHAQHPGFGLDGNVLDLIIREMLAECDPLEARVAKLERWRRSFTP